MTKAFMLVSDVFDVERVEVMRGPQGTAFGCNATIGLIHVISARPENEFGAGVNIGDASTSGIGLLGELSFDLSDQWNLTIGGRYSDDTRNYDYTVQGWAILPAWQP